MIAESGMDPSPEQQDALEAAHPGIGPTVDQCFDLADPGTVGGNDGPTSTIGLPDGRSLVIVGSGSIDMSDGYSATIEGRAITYKDGVVTVDGETVTVPDFANQLEIRVVGGQVELTGS